MLLYITSYKGVELAAIVNITHGKVEKKTVNDEHFLHNSLLRKQW